MTGAESPGGAAPPEPKDEKIQEWAGRLWVRLITIDGPETDEEAEDAAQFIRDAFEDLSKPLRATLDQAESEIARLREENAAARCEALALFNAMDHGPAEPLDTVAGIISQISNMVAGLRPPGETAQQVTPVDVSVAYNFCERMAKHVTPFEYVITDDDVREAYEAWTALDLAGLAAPSVSPSVPQEDSMAKTLSSQIGRTSRD